jgi:hypothetical protein
MAKRRTLPAPSKRPQGDGSKPPRLCKNPRPVFGRISGSDGAVRLYSGRPQVSHRGSLPIGPLFPAPAQIGRLGPQYPDNRAQDITIPHARIASISDTIPSTFITRFRL